MNKNIIFGIKPLIEAIRAGKEIDKVLIQKNITPESSRELFSLIRDYRIPSQKVPVEKLNRISKKNHQGFIAFVSAISFASLDGIIHEVFAKGEDPLILVLDRITDIRNFGAIVRTAECAGVHAILIPAKGSAALNADAMKTSAGALNHVSICRTNNLKAGLDDLRNSGIRIIGMTEKAEQDLYSSSLSGPLAILMGSEEDGISPEFLRMSDELVKIPMKGKLNSLNVSVSAGVGLYEVIRQRDFQT